MPGRNIVMVLKYVKVFCKRKGIISFSVSMENNTTDNGFRLQQERLKLVIRGSYFCRRDSEASEDIVDLSALMVLQTD